MSARGKLDGLEVLRGFAASYVFVTHAGLADHGPLKLALSFGQEAVILFFLLSGFVIRYSTRRKQPALADYARARFVRIYPIFVCALALSYGVRAINAHAWVDPQWPTLVGNLLMLQDASALKPGVLVDPYFNMPLWSLSYEWWFYLAFAWCGLSADDAALARRTPLVFGCSALGALSYCAVPNQASLFVAYFGMWWAGAVIADEYRATGTVSFRGQRTTLIGLGSVALLWAGNAYLKSGSGLLLGTYPVLQLRHALAALAFAVAAIWFRPFTLSDRNLVGRVFLRIAPVSYALYVVHYPVVTGTRAALPHMAPVVVFPLEVGIVLAIAWLLEVRMLPALRTAIRPAASPPAELPST